MEYKTSDLTIRNALIDKLNTSYSAESPVLINEYCLSNTGTRADVVLIENELHGFELKSDRDVLSRLPRQIYGYNKVLDKITLVVGKTHVKEVLFLIPDWWGLMIAHEQNGAVTLHSVREALLNPMQDLSSLAQLLHRNELVIILSGIGKKKSLSNKSKRALISMLLDVLDEESLRSNVIDTLSMRVRQSSQVVH